MNKGILLIAVMIICAIGCELADSDPKDLPRLIQTREIIRNSSIEGRIIEGPERIAYNIGIIRFVEIRHNIETVNYYGALVSMDQEWTIGEPVTSTFEEVFNNNFGPIQNNIRFAYKKGKEGKEQ